MGMVVVWPADASSSVSGIGDGPVAWMSPEVLLDRNLSSKKADVYMLGGLLHEIMTGPETG